MAGGERGCESFAYGLEAGFIADEDLERIADFGELGAGTEEVGFRLGVTAPDVDRVAGGAQPGDDGAPGGAEADHADGAEGGIGGGGRGLMFRSVGIT